MIQAEIFHFGHPVSSLLPLNFANKCFIIIWRNTKFVCASRITKTNKIFKEICDSKSMIVLCKKQIYDRTMQVCIPQEFYH